jgi:hypothetical protein
MLRWFRRRQEAHRLAHADAGALFPGPDTAAANRKKSHRH